MYPSLYHFLYVFYFHLVYSSTFTQRKNLPNTKCTGEKLTTVPINVMRLSDRICVDIASFAVCIVFRNVFKSCWFFFPWCGSTNVRPLLYTMACIHKGTQATMMMYVKTNGLTQIKCFCFQTREAIKMESFLFCFFGQWPVNLRRVTINALYWF